MGSSGEKRKGRKHLPKVGTGPEREFALREEELDVVGNFGLHPKNGWWIWIGVAVVALLILAGVIALAVV
jgi:hypothetical protein